MLCYWVVAPEHQLKRFICFIDWLSCTKSCSNIVHQPNITLKLTGSCIIALEKLNVFKCHLNPFKVREVKVSENLPVSFIFYLKSTMTTDKFFIWPKAKAAEQSLIWHNQKTSEASWICAQTKYAHEHAIISMTSQNDMPWLKALTYS